MPQESYITQALGLPFDLLEEAWTNEDGPGNEEFRVMQRCLLVLGYPSGENGRAWLDGVVGPHTRRILKQWQSDNDLPVTGRFDEPSRELLYQQAAELLRSKSEEAVIGYSGQLQRVAAISEVAGKTAIYYYLTEARNRVDEDLVPFFLALTVFPSQGRTVATLDLDDFQRRLDDGENPIEARIQASRFGFLQLKAKIYQQADGLDLQCVQAFGDISYHLDIIAYFLKNDEGLSKAAASHDVQAIANWLQERGAEDNDLTARLRQTLQEVRACLDK